MKNLLAFDLGASNGRAILGQFDGETITMRELHRFENNYIEMNGVFYWDLPYLYNQLKQGLLAFKNANVGELDCIGIDTWGVDYGLLDQNGQLLSNPRSYRYAVDEDMEAVWKTVDFPTLFARTGIATMNFNTVYQLYRRKRQHDPALDAAQTLLMLPDLLGFFLTGEAKTEYTNATTSMLYNPTTKDWDWQTIDALGLPRKIFTKLDRAGALRGTLRPELAEELGINQAHFAAVGTHDTASAVAAIPGTGSFAFCSSGMVAVRRGDGRTDSDGRSSRREFLQRGHDPGRLPASEKHHGPVAHPGMPERLAEGRHEPQLERHCRGSEEG